MKIHNVIVHFARTILALGVLAAAPSLLWAQAEGPAFVSARLVEVQSGHNAEFEAAVADISAQLEASGTDFFLVFERIRGGLPGYTIFTPDGLFNGTPPPNLDPNFVARATGASNGSTLMSLAFFPELSIVPPPAERGGQFLHVRAITTSPSNAQAFLDFQRDELTPAMRDAGIKDRRFSRVVLGGNTNTFVNFRPLDSYPPQGPNELAESMGQRNYDRMIARAPSQLTLK